MHNPIRRGQRLSDLRICSGRRVACEVNIVAAGSLLRRSSCEGWTAASTEGKRITHSTFEGNAFGLGGTASKTMKTRGKRFDNAPRFTLKTWSSVSVRKHPNSNHRQSHDHKPTYYFHVHAVALASCFFFAASFGSFCRYHRSHCVLATTGGSRARRRDWPVSIKQDRAVGYGTHCQWSAGGISRRAG